MVFLTVKDNIVVEERLPNDGAVGVCAALDFDFVISAHCNHGNLRHQWLGHARPTVPAPAPHETINREW